MPLFKGKSKKAFGHNAETEMDAGKPQKQALAIAYSMKRKKKAQGGDCMASGGMVKSGDPEMDYADGGYVKGVHTSDFGGQTGKVDLPKGQSAAGHAVRSSKKPVTWENPQPGDQEKYKGAWESVAKKQHQKTMNEAAAISGPTSGKSGFAEGGFIGSYQSECHEHCNHPGQTHEQASGYAPETHPLSSATHQGLTDAGLQSSDHEEDMVTRAMKRRGMQMLSKGGRVANQDEPIADFMPNEFDVLHLEDGLEFEDTGANSGDEHGDPRSHEEDDLVSRAMLRKKAKR